MTIKNKIYLMSGVALLLSCSIASADMRAGNLGNEGSDKWVRVGDIEMKGGLQERECRVLVYTFMTDYPNDRFAIVEGSQEHQRIINGGGPTQQSYQNGKGDPLFVPDVGIRFAPSKSKGNCFVIQKRFLWQFTSKVELSCEPIAAGDDNITATGVARLGYQDPAGGTSEVSEVRIGAHMQGEGSNTAYTAPSISLGPFTLPSFEMSFQNGGSPVNKGGTTYVRPMTYSVKEQDNEGARSIFLIQVGSYAGANIQINNRSFCRALAVVKWKLLPRGKQPAQPAQRKGGTDQLGNAAFVFGD